MNIPVVAATGNSFTGAQGEGFPAIVQGTISVTATDLSDNLLPDAQRLGTSVGGSSATVIAAPGEGFTAPSGDSGSSSVDGTSFAAPLVSGGIVLLQQIYEQRFGTLPTVDQIQSWLQGGSDPISDPVTGITLGELDIPKAAALIPTAASVITPSPSVTSTLQVSTTSVAPTPSSTSTQTTTAVTAPAAPKAPAVTSTAVSSPTPTPSPLPTPTPTSAPAQAATKSNQQVISDAGDESNASGKDSSGSTPPAVSGLALLLQSMQVWAASSSRG
jgi:subtilisin family serine protease